MSTQALPQMEVIEDDSQWNHCTSQQPASSEPDTSYEFNIQFHVQWAPPNRRPSQWVRDQDMINEFCTPDTTIDAAHMSMTIHDRFYWVLRDMTRLHPYE